MAQIRRYVTIAASCLKVISQANANPIQDLVVDVYSGYGGGVFGRSDDTASNDFDPEDFSAIKTVATIGDSYAAGIGAGNRTNWVCSRYDHSYPSLLANYEGLANASFQFLACSGALSTDVLANQVPSIKGPADVITISAGGNDVGLVDILNDCIFGWKIVGYSSSSCDKTLNRTDNLISNRLPGALDKLINAAKAKLTPKTGRIYYTAYAQFFGISPQCNGVYWNFWSMDPFAQALSLDRRQRMNTLANKVNQAIEDAVTRAGSQVAYVDYDNYYTNFNGRFCEIGVTEPSPERDNLLFFERNTTNPTLEWKVKRDISESTQSLNSRDATGTSTNDSTMNVDPDEIVANGTFEGSVAAMLSSTLVQNPSWVGNLSDGIFQVLEVGTPPDDGSVPHIISASPPNNSTSSAKVRRGAIGDFLAWAVKDEVKRVFHPRPRGHSLIASLVIYHMEVQNALMNPAPEYMNNVTNVWTELGPALSCSVQGADIPINKLNSTSGKGN